MRAAASSLSERAFRRQSQRVTRRSEPLLTVFQPDPSQADNFDRGLHTEVTVLTVHPGSEFVQGQKLLGLCTSCGVEEGAVETGGKNGTKSSARRASHINRHLIAKSAQPTDSRGNLHRVRAERSTAPTMHYRVFL